MKSAEEIYQRIAHNELAFKRPSEFGCMLFLTCFFVFPTALAIYDLRNYDSTPIFSLICCALWLGFAGLLLYSLREQGWRKAAFATLSNCVRNRFIEVSQDTDPVLGIGFWFRGKRHYELKVRGSGITALEWSGGQASYHYHQNTGRTREFNDWHVTLWFESDQVEVGKRDLFLIGLECYEAEAAEFGRLLGRFLAENGICLGLATDDIIGQIGIVGNREGFRYDIQVKEHQFRTLFNGELTPGSKVEITGQQGTRLNIKPLL